MKTRCPACQTSFRVTPEQLKARAGKVRCGQCQSVFNALDGLLDESVVNASSNRQAALADAAAPGGKEGDQATGVLHGADLAANAVQSAIAPSHAQQPGEAKAPLGETAALELAKASGLILPRESTEIPGYSKWAEGGVFGPESMPEDKAVRWPFVLASSVLVLTLFGQLLFHFRSEVAITSPSLRPMLEKISSVFGASVPLPRHVELVSIETSDLQTDPARGNLLVLNATLRNRANYEQDYPSLELSLTDTDDAAIARRVFRPDEYLPSENPPDQPFAAHSDVAVRLWIEASDISAAGYRLYVFYP